MADPRIASYLSANKSWASSSDFRSPIPFLDMQKKGRSRPDGTVTILACCDPRLNIEQIFGIGTGMSTAVIVRTAGGRIHAALNTLLNLSAVGSEGKKGVIIVVHHTDCGLTHITDDEVKENLKKRASGQEEEKEIDGMVFGTINDPEKTVKEDVKVLKESSFFKGTQIVGLVHDTHTGFLKEVVGVE